MKVYIPAIVWAIIILVLSGLPGQNLPQFNFGSLFEADKIGHFGVYFILSLCLFWAFFKQKRLNAHFAFLAILISSSYGILMEIGQYSIFPGRYFEFFDIVANIIGSISSLIFFKFINTRELR